MAPQAQQTQPFDPDAFMASRQSSSFDPDAFMASRQSPKTQTTIGPAGPPPNILPRVITDLALSGIEPKAIPDIWNIFKEHFGDAVAPGTGKKLSDVMNDAEQLANVVGSEAVLLGAGGAVEDIGMALERSPKTVVNTIAKIFRSPETGKVTLSPSAIAERIIPQRPLSPLPSTAAPLPESGEFYENRAQDLMRRQRQQDAIDRATARQGKLSEMASPSFGTGGTFTNAPNLPPAEPYTAPPIGSTTNPNIRIVRQFEPEPEPEPSRIVSPSSKPPATRVTYQSVPKTDLKNLVMEGDKEAITEWQRRGLPLPDNVRFLIESGATRNPWRNYTQ